MNLKPMLKLMAEKNASDLFFTPMAPIKIKIEGQIINLGSEPLTGEQGESAVFGIMNEDQKETLTQYLEIDWAIS